MYLSPISSTNLEIVALLISRNDQVKIHIETDYIYLGYLIYINAQLIYDEKIKFIFEAALELKFI